MQGFRGTFSELFEKSEECVADPDTGDATHLLFCLFQSFQVCGLVDEYHYNDHYPV